MILLVAEKPSIAEMIAKNYGESYRKLDSANFPTYVFFQYFEGAKAEFMCTSVAGHVFELDFDSELNKPTTPHERLFDKGHVCYSLTNSGTVASRHLKAIGNRATQLILCLDNDREGENICFEVVRILKPVLQSSCIIKRARFSAVTRSEIQRAFSNLDIPNKNYSDAVEARQELDLKIGVAFTRFQTAYLHAQFGDLQATTISYGPCQTPTLSFCVERHDQIARFKPKQIFSLNITTTIGNNRCQLRWQGSPSENRNEIEQKLKRLTGKDTFKLLKITNFKSSRRTAVRPVPMNTIAMLKAASTALGLSPNAAMARAEHLYISGYLSYPRTESTAYPAGYDLKAIVKSLQEAQSHKIAQYAQNLLQPGSVPEVRCKKGYTAPRRGTDQGDHPPIMPTGLVPKNLNAEEMSLYNLVCKHFLATVSSDAVCNVISLNLQSVDLPSEEFSLSLVEEVDLGWKALYSTTEFRNLLDCDSDNDEDENEDVGSAVLTENALRSIYEKKEDLVIASADLRASMTKPPGYLSESDLLGLMEKHGIGTDASMATHIGNIVTREYVKLSTTGRRRCLIPTSMGISLIHGYQLIDSDLSSSQLRASIEGDVTRIAEGKISKDTLVDQVLAKFLKKFLYFRQNISKLEALLDAKYTSIKKAGIPFVLCGDCNRYTNLIEKYPQRIYCATCDKLYVLPLRGQLSSTNTRCPHDNWALVIQIDEKTQKRSYVCPHCYVHGLTLDQMGDYKRLARAADCSLDLEQTKGLTCSICLNGDCKMSLRSNYLGLCCNHTPLNSAVIDVIKGQEQNVELATKAGDDDVSPVEEAKQGTGIKLDIKIPPKKNINIVISKTPSNMENKPATSGINIKINTSRPGKTPDAQPIQREAKAAVNLLAQLSGSLYISPGIGHRTPAVSCNGCSFQAVFPACKLKRLTELCACGCLKLQAYKFIDAKHADKDITGCISCDSEAFAAVAEYKTPDENRSQYSRNYQQRRENSHGGHGGQANRRHGRHH